MLTFAQSATDSGLIDACGEEPRGLACEQVYEWTESEGLAIAAEWLVDRLLDIVFVEIPFPQQTGWLRHPGEQSGSKLSEAEQAALRAPTTRSTCRCPTTSNSPRLRHPGRVRCRGGVLSGAGFVGSEAAAGVDGQGGWLNSRR